MHKITRKKAIIETKIKNGDKTKIHDHDITPAIFNPINNTVKSIAKLFIFYLAYICYLFGLAYIIYMDKTLSWHQFHFL